MQSDRLMQGLSPLVVVGAGVLWVFTGCSAGVDPARLEREGISLTVPSRVDAADLQTPLERTLGSVIERAESWGLLMVVQKVLARTERAQRIQRSATTNELRRGPLSAAFEDCVRIVHVDPPRVFIKADFQANAFVTGVGEPVLVLHEKLVRELSVDELRFVIGHELAHIKCQHVFVRMLVESLGRAAERIGTGTAVPPAVLKFLQSGLAILVLKWYRETEYSADRGGLLCVQDLDLARTAIAKVSGGLDPDRIDQDAADFERQFEELMRSPGDTTVVRILELFQTHGFGASRIRRLTQFAGTDRYRQILARR